ncbi:histidine kinase [Virgisporangium aliadipatigenens]|uniref:histidine kinase n=1 Tax=Virgisporangium aliadipatigenens TaxID=741659 RepID=A0A8J3YNZ6_9ACTN|nr:sensor histidine kinase [Virgisporangium aliadipatigenens]GIJ49064.1 histidine kinase [Virgisporangium aliadipatigenens]
MTRDSNPGERTRLAGLSRLRGRFWRLRDRRIRVKLAVILALPVLAVVVLTGVGVVTTNAGAERADDARRMVAVGGAGAELVALLQRERATAALVAASPTGSAALADYRRLVTATDSGIERFRAALAAAEPGGAAAVLVRRIEQQLNDLPQLRLQVQGDQSALASVVIFRYRAVIADLVSYRETLSQLGVDVQTATNLRANAALTQAIESLGLMQVAVIRAIDPARQTAPPLTPALQQEIVGSDTGFDEAFLDFRNLAPAQWQAELNSRVGGTAVVDAERLQGIATRLLPGSSVDLDGANVGTWSAAIGTRMDLLHAVEQTFDRQLLRDVTNERDEARNEALTIGGAVGLLLLVMLAIGWWVTRSLSRSLHRLRTGAEAVATERLPSMVEELGAENVDEHTIRRLEAEAAEPIEVEGADEVGQVASAFNSVSAAAVRIAGEQAVLRASVSGIFVSVSRRLQRRADVMMLSLDGLERDEQDPERLRKLFDLDHVATLIRRLIANLQVLAGGRAGRPTPTPVSLPDLLRAAGSEVDDYQRVELADVDGGVRITRDAAEELVHLLAELIDNAAKFSPPEKPVVVEGRHVGDRLHLQIRDSGIGMREAELNAARDRIANPRRIDQRTTQQMGLPVVGAIAERLGITVDFRSVPEEGTRVDLTVPSTLFVLGAGAREAPTEEILLPVDGKRTVPAPAKKAPTAPRSKPPQWPPAQPAPTMSPVSVVDSLESVEPVIFEEMRRSWAFPEGEGESTAEGAAPVGTGWQEAARAAEAVRSATVEEKTRSGLPVRDPGKRVIPPPDLSVQPQAPMKRKPEDVRRQMSAFQSGLGAAGRRTNLVLVEEN